MERIKYLKLADGYLIGRTEAEGRDLFLVKDAVTGTVNTVPIEDVCATRAEVISKLVVIENATPLVSWDSPRSDEPYEHGGRLYLDLVGEHLEAQTEIVGSEAILEFLTKVSQCCTAMGDYLLNEHPDNPHRSMRGVHRVFADALSKIMPSKEDTNELA